ncbi:hypothetical protein BJX66DRAFT_344756 [Aspergillus keveii]|uniref:NAD(P)-binding protein n=1 Tax=Aspergillus keveii TaxID=714993 RepID=A0ABR4FK81_9EURO
MADNKGLDPHMIPKLNAFTKKLHRDVYPAVDPNRPEHSQAGKVVVITGASRGLGRFSFAVSFARAGAKGIALLGRSAEDLAETEKLVGETNPETPVHSIAVSVTDAAGVEKAFDEIVERFGVPHVLVNNAGAMASADTIFDSDIESWWETQEVNVKGTLIATKAFLRKVGPAPSAPTTIINLTSGASIGAIPRLSSYSISKMVNTKLTQYLQVEHPTITSVCIDPGVVETSWTDKEALAFLLPLGRDTFELVGAVGVWVASGDKSFLSGRYLSINWDVEELEARKEEIVEKDLLTLFHRGGFGGPDRVVV